jgi:hypothetical protein
MPKSNNRTKYYYYASGEQVELILDPHWVAVDEQRADSANIPQKTLDSFREATRSLKRGVVLVEREAISNSVLNALDAAHALQPVFKVDGSLLIALPEVRVEESSPSLKRAFHIWLEQNRDLAVIVQEDAERITLRPPSGNGTDALNLSNRLTEEVGVEMAQPRFIRLSARPTSFA